MSMRTIETVVNIEADRRLVVQLPADVAIGRHRIAVTLDDAPESAAPVNASGPELWKFPVVAEAQWPADMPLTRSSMYDDDGR